VLDEVEGEMGVAVTHVETGQFLEVHGTKGYPMASTFKLPILVELFNQVDQGKLNLGEMVSIDTQDLHLGSGQLRRFAVPGVSLSIENLALLMMRISDNSATDMLLERVGVDNVNRRLVEIGVEGITVNRSCQKLILDWLGFDIERTRGMSYQEIESMLNDYEPQPGEMEAAAAAFADDPQDTATPIGMNFLLERIFKGTAASPTSCEKMTEILLKCDTGRNRLRGLLPSSVDVAHKTGTIGGTVNNVGIIYLPHKRGHVIVSVLSKKMEDREEAERAIAEIARYAFDYFLFTAPESQKAKVGN
jgi:beta-lactamase class A